VRSRARRSAWSPTRLTRRLIDAALADEVLGGLCPRHGSATRPRTAPRTSYTEERVRRWRCRVPGRRVAVCLQVLGRGPAAKLPCSRRTHSRPSARREVVVFKAQPLAAPRTDGVDSRVVRRPVTDRQGAGVDASAVVQTSRMIWRRRRSVGGASDKDTLPTGQGRIRPHRVRELSGDGVKVRHTPAQLPGHAHHGRRRRIRHRCRAHTRQATQTRERHRTAGPPRPSPPGSPPHASTDTATPSHDDERATRKGGPSSH